MNLANIVKLISLMVLLGVLTYLFLPNIKKLMQRRGAASNGPSTLWKEYWTNGRVLPSIVLCSFLFFLLAISFGDWMDKNIAPHWGIILICVVGLILAGSILAGKNAKAKPFKERLAKITILAVLVMIATTVFGTPKTWTWMPAYASSLPRFPSSQRLTQNKSPNEAVAPPPAPNPDPEEYALAKADFEIDYPFLFAVEARESGYNPYEVGANGKPDHSRVLHANIRLADDTIGKGEAVGSLQIQPSWWKKTCNTPDLNIEDPKGNHKCAEKIYDNPDPEHGGPNAWKPAPDNPYKKLLIPIKVVSNIWSHQFQLPYGALSDLKFRFEKPIDIRLDGDDTRIVRYDPLKPPALGVATYLEFCMVDNKSTDGLFTFVYP